MGAKSTRVYKRRDLTRGKGNIEWAIEKLASNHEVYADGAPEISAALLVSVEMLIEVNKLIDKILEEL